MIRCASLTVSSSASTKSAVFLIIIRRKSRSSQGKQITRTNGDKYTNMSFVFPNQRFIIFSFFAVLFIIFVPSYFFKRLYSVDGGYSDWSTWSYCIKNCGHSLQGRYRNCTRPKPSGFGKDCIEIGSQFETRPCMNRECPVAGGIGQWSDWGECSKTCQDGERKRSRKCDNPAPAFGGQYCSENLEETQKCLHLKPCPIDGGFSNWGQFNACSATCGKGHKIRSRECNNPAPQFGGNNCAGNLQEVVDCHEKDCEVPTTSPPNNKTDDSLKKT